jgi:hypothetical protein
VFERRAAAGVLDGASDLLLEQMDQRASQVIASVLNVSRVGVLPLTIRPETVRETIRPDGAVSCLVTARRFISAVPTLIADGETLAADEYEFDGPAGMIWRLSGDRRMPWLASKIVVTYTAGFSPIPFDIKLAAGRLIAGFFRESGRDPNLKRVRVEGIGEREYWAGSTSDPAVPLEVRQILEPYRTKAMS